MKWPLGARVALTTLPIITCIGAAARLTAADPPCPLRPSASAAVPAVAASTWGEGSPALQNDYERQRDDELREAAAGLRAALAERRLRDRALALQRREALEQGDVSAAEGVYAQLRRHFDERRALVRDATAVERELARRGATAVR